MTDIIIIAVLAAIVCGILFYLIRAKKRGEKCIGCPYSKECGGKCGAHNENTERDG